MELPRITDVRHADSRTTGNDSGNIATILKTAKTDLSQKIQ